jgi:hypothetical protein
VGEAEEIPLFFTLIPVLALLSNYHQENCLINVGTEGRTKSDFAEQRAVALCAKIDRAAPRAEQQASKRSAIMQNVDLFIESFNMRPALLIQEVACRHNYDQVLEIFQRVNSGGMTLTKSDLMFCTLKLKVQDMEERFSDALRTINQVGRYAFTRDFLIKASLVLFGQGAQYEVNKLKSDNFITTLRDSFDDLYHCLRQLVTWLETTARINNARFLRSDNALIPILDYMYHSGKHDQPEGSDSRFLLQYLYMAFLTRLFSRGGDRTLDQLHTRITQALQTSPGVFPIRVVRDYICKRMNVSWELAEHHFADDPELMLNIVDNGALQLNAQQHGGLKLERDHIFPRKVLADHGIGDLVDYIGNYRLVVMPINRRKKADMPTNTTDFFGRDDETLEPLYQAALANLTRETYQSFQDERKARIIAAVKGFLDLDQASTADEASAPASATSPAQGAAFITPEREAKKPLPTGAHTPAPLANTGNQGDRTIGADSSGLNVEGLRSAYQGDPAVRLLVDHFGSRQRNQTLSPVETLERALSAAATPLAHHIIIDALKRLDALGIGRFIPGRKGHPTRFQWKVKSLETRALATGGHPFERHA